MQHRTNPRNGDSISALGLGCMRLPGPPGRPDPERARAIIACAVERGINYLDTAYLYPGNEACVGAALDELGLRDRVLLATKLPHGSVRATADLDRIFDEQLRRLRTDRVDYYLIHNVTSPAQWERLRDLGIEDWVARQRAAGRIRQTGFSYHGSAGDFPVLLDAYDWDFCQIQYNYAGEQYQAGTAGLHAAAARGLAVFVMEPLLGGRLADKLPDRARRILDAAAAPGLETPAAWGLSWVWDHPEVTMLLSGMAAPEQVEENAAVACRALPGSLTPAQHEVIARVVEEFARTNRVPCTGCNYCMPCPQGINIPGCFSAYNASFAHGWFTGLSQYFTASAVRTSAPKLVSNCVRCGACARHCPQGIDIPARLVDVGRRFQPGPVGWALRAWSRRGR
ncbi:aldo/keto reductase [Thermophilibacter sp. ET337]|uniref:aldo/keto reductase n=1 Tax=Thermophilibacter sp. ET337 TaxID=2973084 RepID=UPI0021AB9F5A|nr:aldo/keto reductase [Thermophilibacter sp. ET337]MCR8907262.1 aldo/keto reductase [Thermophilibacter sp. ET337]